MPAPLLALLLAVVLSSPFGEATARAEPVGSGLMELELEVAVEGTPETVVAHLLAPAGRQETVALRDRGTGRFGAVVEVERADLRVVFEALYGDGEAHLSEEVSLRELGVDLSEEEAQASSSAASSTRAWGWAALAAGSLALAALALWTLGRGEDEEPARSDLPRLFIPGPVDVEPEVLAAQARPMIGHRSDAFESLFAEVEEGMRWALASSQPVLITASSGSGWHEGAIRNLVDRRVLCVVQGAFGDRWHEAAADCGKEALRLDLEWGRAATPERVLEALERLGPVEAVTVVHNETSTGAVSPVGGLAEALRAEHPEMLLLVDAVSSAGGMPTPVDQWGTDLLLTSSQKAFALPPGLAFVAVSERAADKATRVEARGWYFDIPRLLRYRERSTTPATPAISLMRAAALRLKRMRAEGLDARHARHRRLGELTRSWVRERGFGLFPEEGYASDTLTCVANTRGVSIGELDRYLRNRGMAISGGYGDLRERTFRIAHMGERTEAEMRELLETIDGFLD